MQITQFTKPVADGGMTKTIKLGPDGKPAPDGSPCRMWRGEARVYDLMDVHELALLIDKCSTQQALAFGSIKPEFLNGGGPVQVVKKDALASPTPGVIARTKKHLWFPPGEDGAMVVDHDRKGMPANVETKMAGRGLWDVLIEVAPGLAQAGRVERASTSAGLMNTATGECFPAAAGCMSSFTSPTPPTFRAPPRLCTTVARLPVTAGRWCRRAARSCGAPLPIWRSEQPSTWRSKGRR